MIFEFRAHSGHGAVESQVWSASVQSVKQARHLPAAKSHSWRPALRWLPPLLLMPSRGALAAPNAMCAGTASPGMRNVEDTDNSLRLPGCAPPPSDVAMLLVGLQTWVRGQCANASPGGSRMCQAGACIVGRTASLEQQGPIAHPRPVRTVPAACQRPSAAAL